jgi:hypothetical protein
MDGCVYCDTTEDICVQHVGAMSMIKFEVFDSPVVTLTRVLTVLATKISEGNLIGNFTVG